MKKIITLITLIVMVSFGFGQTTLGAGDIAITGFNSSNPDQFSFVLLTDITASTEIKFTDNGQQTIDYNVTDEGIITWTATTSLSCGTEIIITDTGSNTYSATSGTAVESGAGFALAAAGDQILAYQGSDATPTFVYAITFGAVSWTDADNTQTTTLPAGLTDGQNAVYVGNDLNGTYDCSVISNQSLILTAVSTDTNWTLSNTIVTLGSCTYTCVPCPTTTTWDGTTWSAGAPDLTTEAVLNANYNTTTNGSFNACSLIVNATFRLTIDNGGYVEVENDLTVDGELFVETEGAFVQNNNLGTVTENGTIRVIKTTSPLSVWYEYTYWSSPVSGETIGDALTDADVDRRFSYNGANFLDATAENNNDNTTVAGQDDVDDDGNDWSWQSGANVMIPGVGYAATHSSVAFVGPPMTPPPYQFDYVFEGPFNNGTITVPIYRNDEELNDNNWNFIGNPYPSAIDADLFLAANSNISTSVPHHAVLDGAIFMWSQNAAPTSTNNGNQNLNFAASDYAVINAVGQTAGGDGVTPTRNIPSGQGFFVTMDNAAPSSFHSVGDPGVAGDIVTADVVFDNSMRVTGNNNQFFRTTNTNGSNIDKLWIDLTSDGGTFNQTLIAYTKNATDGDDGMAYDTKKNLSVDAAAVLYSNMDGENSKYVIQAKNSNSLNENEVISIGFKTSITEATIFALSIPQFEGDFLTNNDIYLKDNLLNTIHNLKDGDYNFTSEVGEFNDRFEIGFTEDALSVNNNSVSIKALSIIEHSNGDVQFKLSASSKMQSIQIIDLQGRELYNFKLNSKDKTYRLSGLSQAPYIAKVTLDSQQVLIKKAIKRY